MMPGYYGRDASLAAHSNTDADEQFAIPGRPRIAESGCLTLKQICHKQKLKTLQHPTLPIRLKLALSRKRSRGADQAAD